ncbi:MAG: hypothetical protein ACRCTF_03795 [Bacteroidales bacterium]
MNRKSIILRILYILIAVTIVAAAVCYMVLPTLMGSYIAMCAVVLVLNFLISIFFVNKNFK